MLLTPALVLQHVTREGPGRIAEALKKFDVPFDLVDLEQGDDVPMIADAYSCVIVLGGPQSANDATTAMQHERELITACLQKNVPYLGICLGMQTLVKAAGGTVLTAPVKEIGCSNEKGEQYTVTLTDAAKKDPFFNDIPAEFPLFHLHGETVELNKWTTLMGKGNIVPNQVVKAGNSAYGIQGHLELTPEMLEEWIATDPALQAADAAKLRKEFAAIEKTTAPMCEKMVENLLLLADQLP